MKRVLLLLASLYIPVQLHAQVIIRGNVCDENNQPVEGVNIYLSPGNTGTISDSGGNFLLPDIYPAEYEIHLSHVGYTTKSEKINADKNLTLNFTMETTIILGDEIIVRATRAGKNTPTTWSVVKKEDIEKQNLGQDLPYLLGMEPSLVYSSDAGAGIGYTGMWIRGSNIQRINVTINGVPLNDPESHTVYWVDIPDFASSVQSVQIQRGVGTSTNGGGAFGATVNLETSSVNQEPYGELDNDYGSFNTLKNTLRLGTGIIKNHWIFEGRASSVTSDGYIDRAASDLKSYFLQGAYIGNSTTVKAIVFGGKEKTYQAWYGVNRDTLKSNRTFNWAGAIYDDAWNITGFYNNEIDFYLQDHAQLHLSQQLNRNLSLNVTMHYTYGRGYYEEYYSNEYLGDYPIGVQVTGGDTIEYGDLIVRRWLDNKFYGTTGALFYNKGKFNLTLGSAWNEYSPAKHYGDIIWSEYTGNSKPGDKFYKNLSKKTDFNIFGKSNISLTNNLDLFADLQIRRVDHTMHGIDKGGAAINIDAGYTFFNPKAGLTFTIDGIGSVYASYAVANREPIRDDFLDAPDGVTPEPERLQDFETGIRNITDRISYSLNSYFMLYNNQLVLNGQINDVGLPVRENVGKSYRAGIELDLRGKINDYVWLRGNISAGTSHTDFVSYEDNQLVTYNNVQLTFSPQLISGYIISIKPAKMIETGIAGKYVSRQFLDLTGNKDRSLDPWYVNNLRILLTMHPALVQELKLYFQVNNIWNAKYSSNGYVWDDTPYFFPQAGINFLTGISLRF